MHQARERAGSGHGQVVAVIGEPGVGKSRLFWEFTQSHRTQGWLLLASHSVSYGKATAYLPVLDLLKGYFQIEPQDDARRRRTLEAIKRLLLRERQRLLHGRIVEAIEHQYADRLADQVERLAHHALRGEVWDKAVAYFRQAGDKAVARSAHREAAACFEQALVALAHLPEGCERHERAIDVRFGLRHAPKACFKGVGARRRHRPDMTVVTP
ncbi:MAG TPA: ATP-binding protein [Candidatus Tectomicrobia bacterium]|nr:ATP-binding protein [Candidatus Tectomicrobia bacterium]